jgi:3',5'-cyclic AMP phosphodiesterase CpdA
VEVTGLQPDTAYSYRVAGDHGESSADLSFRTAPWALSESDVTFTVNGDVGTSYMFVDVAPIMRRLAAEPPGLHLIVGDLTYADLYRGTEEEEHWLATDLAVIGSRRPVLVTWGNHEYYRAADVGVETITRYFQLPRTGQPNACNPAPFYSLRYAGILIVALDDPTSPCFDQAAQRAWLGQTLAAAAADPTVVWRVVAVHSPPFSSGCHGGEELNRYPEFDR